MVDILKMWNTAAGILGYGAHIHLTSRRNAKLAAIGWELKDRRTASSTDWGGGHLRQRKQETTRLGGETRTGTLNEANSREYHQLGEEGRRSAQGGGRKPDGAGPTCHREGFGASPECGGMPSAWFEWESDIIWFIFLKGCHVETR